MQMKSSRFVWVVAITAMLVGAAVTFVLERREAASLDPADWTLYGGEQQGWTLRYPPAWRVQPLEPCPFLGYQGAVVVTNTDFVFDGPREGSDACYGRFFFLAGVPTDGVALAFQPHGFRIGLFNPCEDVDTQLPMRPQNLIRTTAIRGGPAMRFQTVCVGDAPIYMVRTWSGRDAPDWDVRALGIVLGSLQTLREPAQG